MSGFSRDWLALREPFDAAARSRELGRRFADLVPPGGLVADLGAGTGANARYLAPMFGERVRWRLVDADPDLLSEARGHMPRAMLETARVDLAQDLDSALVGASAVTASALLDLVSRSWVDRLVDTLAARRLPALFALSVDGRHVIEPSDSDDNRVLAAFARHQGRDKGFGPSLGPAASAVLAENLRLAGAAVAMAASDWRIGPDSPWMLSELIGGIAEAAAEAEPSGAAAITGWRTSRETQIADGTLRVLVGHQDVFALWR